MQLTTSRHLVTRWHESVLAFEEKAENWQAATGINYYETKQGDAAYRMLSRYTEALELAIDPDFDWLTWHWRDNNMGKNKMFAQRDAKRGRKIKGLDDLLWLLFLD